MQSHEDLLPKSIIKVSHREKPYSSHLHNLFHANGSFCFNRLYEMYFKKKKKCKSWGIIIPTASPFDLHSLHLSGDTTSVLLDLLPTSHIRASPSNHCNKQLAFIVFVCVSVRECVRACIRPAVFASIRSPALIPCQGAASCCVVRGFLLEP